MESIKTISDKIDNNVINHGNVIKKRHKVFGTELLSDFASNSTLHGLRYVSEKTLSIKEKTFWLIMFLLSIGFCGFLIRNVWIKWTNNPVIITISEQPTPTGKVPFPSVTICPRMKCKSTIYNYTQEYKKFHRRKLTNWLLFDDITLICKNLLSVDIIREPTNAELVHHILEVAPNMTETFSSCFWSDSMYNNECNNIINTVLIEEGLCFNINSLSANEILRMDNVQMKFSYLNTTTTAKGWSIREGYDKRETKPYPRRGLPNTQDVDLSLYLSETIQDRDKICQMGMYGFQLYLQHPTDFPQSSRHMYPIAPGAITSLAIKVNIMDSSDELISYHPDIRKCYYSWERPLRYFKIYTLDNCRLECLSNYTYQKCGCVWFHMPHENSRKLCTKMKAFCMKKVIDLWAVKDLDLEMEDSELSSCKCLPACISVEYEAEVSRDDIYHNDITRSEISYARVNLYFKHPHYMSMRRSEIFGLTDFFSNCGGLLGLFLGFSFLSLVEIFYYFTLRICCASRKKKDNVQEKTSNEDC